MGAAIFIGDELTAAGFRLTGIETIVPKADDAGAAFADAAQRASLIVITAAAARQVPAADIETAMLAERPAVTIIPDALFRAAPPDLIGKLKAALGIET